MRLSSKTVEIGETVLNPDFLSWSSLAMGYLGGEDCPAHSSALVKMSARSWTKRLACLPLERHVRGKWVCNECETLIQKPVLAQLIVKGVPIAGCWPTS